MNMLIISDKLLKILRDGMLKYRMKIGEIKDYYIKYISYNIIAIVNDGSSIDYKRKIIKS